MRVLLDVNVLIALGAGDHLHHQTARRWLRDNIRYGWATCPITQNGCIRVMAQPAYPNSLPASVVAWRLREATSTEHHRFWPDDVNLLSPEVADWSQVIGHRQITDVYLLALAAKRNSRYVTFDARIALTAVPRAGDQCFCII